MDLYFCKECGWGKERGKSFHGFVDHVRCKHRVDVKMGKGECGDGHFCYCNDCPRRKDQHGRHLSTPNAVLNHLREAHGIEGVEWCDADDMMAKLSLRYGG